jgi:hypothetical protein
MTSLLYFSFTPSSRHPHHICKFLCGSVVRLRIRHDDCSCRPYAYRQRVPFSRTAKLNPWWGLWLLALDRLHLTVPVCLWPGLSYDGLPKRQLCLRGKLLVRCALRIILASAWCLLGGQGRHGRAHAFVEKDPGKCSLETLLCVYLVLRHVYEARQPSSVCLYPSSC